MSCSVVMLMFYMHFRLWAIMINILIIRILLNNRKTYFFRHFIFNKKLWIIHHNVLWSQIKLWFKLFLVAIVYLYVLTTCRVLLLPDKVVF